MLFRSGTSTVTNAVNITVGGTATVNNVFGGGSYSSTSDGAPSVGNGVNITVTGGSIANNIFAAGQNQYSTVTGDVRVTFTGSNDYTCNVYGYGVQSSATTGGDKALTFSGYTGTLSGNIGGFDGIVVSGDTTATLSGATIDNADWTFDFTERTLAADTVALTLVNGISTEEELTLTLKLSGDVPATDWSLATGVGDIAGALSGYEVYVGDVELEFASGLVVSGDYAGWGFAIEDTTLKFKHLA